MGTSQKKKKKKMMLRFCKSVYVILSSIDGSLTSQSVEGIQPFLIRTSFIDLNPHY